MGPDRLSAPAMTEMTATVTDASSSGPDVPPGVLTVGDLEALLFVAERPLAVAEIARLAGVDQAIVAERLDELASALQGRGIRLIVSGDRLELATAPEAAPLVAHYVGHEGSRLSPAALETLAIVAYRQPVTRSVIERIRGVDSDYVLRGLLHRRLVVEVGRGGGPGRPFLYGTSFEFLERFGMAGLAELPVLAPDAAALLAPSEAEASEADLDEAPDDDEGS